MRRYKVLDLGLWAGSNSRIATKQLAIPLLAAQTASKNIVAGNPDAGNANSQIIIAWNPTDRTLTVRGNDRIIYAAQT